MEKVKKIYNYIDKKKDPLEKIYNYLDKETNINKKFDISKNEEIMKYNKDINKTQKYIKNIDNGFILVSLLLVLFMTYIIFSAYELNYSCDTFIYYSYIYTIFGILIYGFFILFIIKFVTYTETYKKLKYFYDNYYILFTIIILGLFFILGGLFKENEHKVFISHCILILKCHCITSRVNINI